MNEFDYLFDETKTDINTGKEKKMEAKKVKLTEIKPNPDNPRVLKDWKFEKLKKSLQDFPEMTELREIVVDENMTILGGNMRYRAMQDLGIKECPVKVATGLSEEQKKEFIIKDNLAYGEWDMDELANNWDDALLEDWGFEVPNWDTSKINELEEWNNINDEEFEPPDNKIKAIFVFESENARINFFDKYGFEKSGQNAGQWVVKV